MKLGKVLASVAVATSLVAAPVVAQAAPPNCGPAPTVEGENLRGGFIIPLIALIAIILGILAATGGNSDAPAQPVAQRTMHGGDARVPRLHQSGVSSKRPDRCPAVLLSGLSGRRARSAGGRACRPRSAAGSRR